MNDCGVVYMAWGANAIHQADLSIRTLREHAPGIPVLVVGDADAVRHFQVWNNVTARTIDVQPFDERKRHGQKFLAGRIKPLLYELAPWERTLYVDADVSFIASPQRGFDLLDRWEFVLAEVYATHLGNAPFNPTERQETAAWLGTEASIYHNSGMLFWRRCPGVAGLMRLWSTEWQRYGDWDEQIALLRALFRSEVLYLTVPYTWNTNRASEATLLVHVYGTHVARLEGQAGRAKAQTARRTLEPHLTPDQRRSPSVMVEIAPGLTVKCKAADAEQIKARLEEIMAARPLPQAARPPSQRGRK